MSKSLTLLLFVPLIGAILLWFLWDTVVEDESTPFAYLVVSMQINYFLFGGLQILKTIYHL